MTYVLPESPPNSKQNSPHSGLLPVTAVALHAPDRISIGSPFNPATETCIAEKKAPVEIEA